MGQIHKTYAMDGICGHDKARPELHGAHVRADGVMEASDGKVAVAVPMVDMDGVEPGLLPRDILKRIRKKAGGEFTMDEMFIRFTDKDLGDVALERPENQPEFPDVTANVGPTPEKLAGRRMVRLDVAQLARLANAMGAETVDLYLPADALAPRGVYYVFPVGQQTIPWGIMAAFRDDAEGTGDGANDAQGAADGDAIALLPAHEEEPVDSEMDDGGQRLLDAPAGDAKD